MVPHTTKNWQKLRSYLDSLNISTEKCMRSYKKNTMKLSICFHCYVIKETKDMLGSCRASINPSEHRCHD